MLEELYQLYLKHRDVTTDSRMIRPGCMYFALKGERFNGNEFALDALAHGAVCAVVDEDVESDDQRIVRVYDVLATLQALAKRYRSDWKFPVLAITGSNGKTTTKELVRDVLSRKYRVSATLGNLNNHIGIPLTMLRVPSDCAFAVIEMGANHQCEIAGYCQYAMPTHGLITNIGKAHLEGFGGEEGVFKGKKELYDYLYASGGVVFANTELQKLKEASLGMNPVAYGFANGSFHLSLVSESPTLQFRYERQGQALIINTQLAGGYNLYNVASAVQVGLTFGVPEEDILDAIRSYVPDNNRSQLKSTDRNTLILDAYNANPTSVEHALHSFAKQDHPKRMFILGDMLELGNESIR
ncbi:MAG: UDP-N-acetylmuramoyl-tripeptide--D-alanyl-D-alanine ligase, partial [Flavobacteriales bacterium]